MSYAQIDRDDERLTDLLVTKIPDIHDIVDLGALVLRYPYPHPLGILAQDIGEGWGLTPERLLKRCREIWASGYRPGTTDNGVGSANDTQEES